MMVPDNQNGPGMGQRFPCDTWHWLADRSRTEKQIYIAAEELFRQHVMVTFDQYNLEVGTAFEEVSDCPMGYRESLVRADAQTNTASASALDIFELLCGVTKVRVDDAGVVVQDFTETLSG